jgi:hypothetical protein
MLRRLIQTVLAVAALGAVAGVAYGAIPSSDGTITACVDPKGGIKIVDVETGVTCGTGKKALSWNQQGAAGPAGPAGVSGYETVSATSTTDSTSSRSMVAICPYGKKVIGGGGYVWRPSVGGGTLIVHGIGLVQNGALNENGWTASAEEIVPTSDSCYLQVRAICANVG